MNIAYSTRPYTGNAGTNVMVNSKILDHLEDECDLLMTTKTTKTIDKIREKSTYNFRQGVNFFHTWYHTVGKNLKDWDEVYEKIDVTPLKDYKNIFIFGGLLSEGAALKRGSKLEGEFPHQCRGQIKFVSIGVHICYTLALLKANKEYGIPIHEVVYDPQELSMDLYHESYRPTENYYFYHNYEIPKYNIRRLDTLQYYNQANPQEPVEKDYDFIFGFSIITKDRLPQLEKVNKITSMFQNKKLFNINKFTGEYNFIPRLDYLNYIKRAKYTLIVPAYDAECMSILRIVESLNLDCLPLIEESCVLGELEKSYDVDMSHLVVDSNFKIFSEEERIRLLRYYKSKFCKFEKSFIMN
jgi:hypothetical protein